MVTPFRIADTVCINAVNKVASIAAGRVKSMAEDGEFESETKSDKNERKPGKGEASLGFFCELRFAAQGTFRIVCVLFVRACVLRSVCVCVCAYFGFAQRVQTNFCTGTHEQVCDVRAACVV
jgi:hypothetical protein